MKARAWILLGLVLCLGLSAVIVLPQIGATHHDIPTQAATTPLAATPKKTTHQPGKVGLPPTPTAPPTNNVDDSSRCGGKECATTNALITSCSPSNRLSCCYDNRRFLFFGNSFGRHHNQMSSFTAAVALAARLNRTLVLPPFTDGKQQYQLKDLYDATVLLDPSQSGVCILTTAEFASKQKHVDATCIRMRGIGMLPQKLSHLTINCASEVSIKYKKRLSLFMSTTADDAVRSSRFLTIPLAIYYAQALPLEEITRTWRLIKPHSVIERAVHAFEECTAKSVPNDVLGIHLRSLEGSCGSRVNNFVPDSNPAKRVAVKEQCEMPASLIKAALSKSFEGSGLVIVADDNQQAAKAEKLASETNGLRLRDASKRCPSLASIGKGSIVNEGFWKMNLDFWLLAKGKQFYGNQLSTLSMNVCRKRLAEGLQCENFFEFGVPEST